MNVHAVTGQELEKLGGASDRPLPLSTPMDNLNNQNLSLDHWA